MTSLNDVPRWVVVAPNTLILKLLGVVGLILWLVVL